MNVSKEGEMKVRNKNWKIIASGAFLEDETSCEGYQIGRDDIRELLDEQYRKYHHKNIEIAIREIKEK